MSAALIQRLIEAGTPAALVAEVAMELGKADAERAAIAKRRADDAARQAKRRSGHVTSRDTAGPKSRDVTGHHDEPPPTEPNPLGNNILPPSGGDDNYARDPHRLPADFALSEADRQFARDLGWSDPEVSDEFAGFVDYWSNPKLPGSKALKSNWSATWRNRIRDLSKRRGHGARASPGGGQQLALVPINGNRPHVLQTDRKPHPTDILRDRIAAREARERERRSHGGG